MIRKLLVLGACAAAMAASLCGSAEAQVRALSDQDAAIYASAFALGGVEVTLRGGAEG